MGIVRVIVFLLRALFHDRAAHAHRFGYRFALGIPRQNATVYEFTDFG